VQRRSGLPPIDSVDVWPLVIGENTTSPRTEILVTETCLIQGDLKLIRGSVSPAGWAGVAYPNASTAQHSIDYKIDCGDKGCLFNISADEGEHFNLAEQYPEKVEELGARMDELKKGIWQNNEQGHDSCPPNTTGLCACWMAWNKYDGFLGPYQEVSLAPPPGPMPPPRPSPAPSVSPGGSACTASKRPPTPFAGQDVQLDTADTAHDAKQQWVYDEQSSQFSLHSNTSLCLSVHGVNAAGNPNVVLGLCNDAQANTKWSIQNTGSTTSGASTTQVIKNANFPNDCLDIQRGEYEIELFKCADEPNVNQHFEFDPSQPTDRISVAGGSRAGLAVAVC